VDRVTGDLEHLFERKHHFYRRTQFRTPVRSITVHTLVAAIQPVRLTMERAYVGERVLNSIEVTLFAVPLPSDDRRFHHLGQVYAM